ncbi:Pentatricopeptide repeat-containing protein [Apostasia shenzhenica]|uniref:Pentatricopeptide repeat-containing protein n=1 Tax=Apostasia shenzhenica TaxID=1088818 RepID=A0A2I0BF44_9ASPA|nr:Pentatricopeptide repeat-containing protein [Apostasia shenzhenica]
MIQSYGSNGLFHKAALLMREMLSVGFSPSQAAMINMLKAVTDAAALEMGQQIHALLVKSRELSLEDVRLSTALIDMYVRCGSMDEAINVFDHANERNAASWTAMIAGNGMDLRIALSTALLEMYLKCGDANSARSLFDEMPERDVMCWTVMISGYSQANFFNEAFELFGQMKDLGIRPNGIMMVNLLFLCAEAGALDRGRQLHAIIDQQGIKMDVVLATALVDMYAKCGEMEEAFKAFNGANDADVCMWNALLNGMAMNGDGREAIELFSEMVAAGIKPNEITFVGLLKACSHSGLVEEGRRFFERMSIEFGLVPRVEHYGCIVDLHSRAGLLDEAHEIIRKMPVSPNVVIWGSLIAACRVHGNLKLGEIAAREILKLEPENVGYRVLLSNIYAAQGRWDEVAEVRTRVKAGGRKKAPAMSSIEVNGAIHGFVIGDASHPQAEEIHAMAAEMQRELKRAGHVTNTSVVLLNVEEEEEKASSLCFHSEKLAMAFGLISTKPRSPLRIVKNLRICEDCHAATKLLSEIYGRVIVVRDRNRYHHFSGGSCSCGDYW